MTLLIRENRVLRYDSIWPWVAPLETTFYSVSNQVSTFLNRVDINSTIQAQFSIISDSQVDVYERHTYTVLDLFGELGGLFQIFFLLGNLVIYNYNKRMMKFDLVNTLKSKEPSLYVNKSASLMRDKKVMPISRMVTQNVDSRLKNEVEDFSTKRDQLSQYKYGH